MKTAKESAACQTANSTCTTVQSRGDKLAQREDGGKLWLTRSTVQAVVGKCHCRIKFCNCLYQPCSRNWNLSSISGKCSQPVTQGYPKMRKWIQCDYCPLWYHCLCAGTAHKVPKTRCTSVFLAPRFDNILTILWSRPYMTLPGTVAILSCQFLMTLHFLFQPISGRNNGRSLVNFWAF